VTTLWLHSPASSQRPWSPSNPNPNSTITHPPATTTSVLEPAISRPVANAGGGRHVVWVITRRHDHRGLRNTTSPTRPARPVRSSSTHRHYGSGSLDAKSGQRNVHNPPSPRLAVGGHHRCVSAVTINAPASTCATVTLGRLGGDDVVVPSTRSRSPQNAGARARRSQRPRDEHQHDAHPLSRGLPYKAQQFRSPKKPTTHNTPRRTFSTCDLPLYMGGSGAAGEAGLLSGLVTRKWRGPGRLGRHFLSGQLSWFLCARGRMRFRQPDVKSSAWQVRWRFHHPRQGTGIAGHDVIPVVRPARCEPRRRPMSATVHIRWRRNDHSGCSAEGLGRRRTSFGVRDQPCQTGTI